MKLLINFIKKHRGSILDILFNFPKFWNLVNYTPTSNWFVKKNLGDKNSIKFSTNFFWNWFFLEVMEQLPKKNAYELHTYSYIFHINWSWSTLCQLLFKFGFIVEFWNFSQSLFLFSGQSSFHSFWVKNFLPNFFIDNETFRFVMQPKSFVD